jgi:hypothetical protein
VRRLPGFALLIGVFSLVSCHHYTAPSTAITCTTTTSTSTTISSSSCTDPVTGISIGIAPPTVSVIVATPTQFRAAVSGGTSGLFTWQVNGVAKGNDTVGTIDSRGNYIAPSQVPSPATVNVAAVSSEDPKLSVTSVVTILPPPQVTVSPTCTLVAPCPLTSGTANTKTFTATVTGAPTTNVDWQVNGVLGGNATFGTIDATGVYTAPLTPPVGSIVTVTAVSRDFPLSLDSATVKISGFSTSSFQGHFAFSMSGRVLSGPSSGAFFRAGSFTADGAGHLSGGLEDVNPAACVTTNPFSFVGNYTIGSDGRGTMQFMDGCTPATFSFVLVNSNQLQIIGFDTNGTATGQANLQDISTFHASDFFGTFVFDFAGLHGSSALSQIGEFTSDGAGHITGGSIDINDGGIANPSNPFQISGPIFNPPNPPTYPSFYSINSNGRGTATIATTDATFPTLTFSFYVVSRGSAKFVGTDTTQVTAGVTMQQAPNATFDATSLNGNYAFLLAGSAPGGAIATAGSFSADGNGHLTANTGVLDENVNGTATPDLPFVQVPLPVVTYSGSYTVGSSGRGIVKFNTASRAYNLVFYLGPIGSAVLQEQETYPSYTSDGIFTQQQSAAFSVAFNKGNNYAINTSGVSAGAVQVITGQLGVDGAGNITSGAIIDINTGGTLAPGQTVTGSYTAPAVTTGRATLTLNPGSRTLAAYAVNPTQVYIVEIDNTNTGQLAVGALFRQF